MIAATSLERVTASFGDTKVENCLAILTTVFTKFAILGVRLDKAIVPSFINGIANKEEVNITPNKAKDAALDITDMAISPALSRIEFKLSTVFFAESGLTIFFIKDSDIDIIEPASVTTAGVITLNAIAPPIIGPINPI